MRNAFATPSHSGPQHLSVPRPDGFAIVNVRAVGTYIPSGQPGHRTHRLTQLIRDAKTTRRHDGLFARLLSHIVDHDATHVAAVPPRPGADDRLEGLRWLMARALGALDAPCLSQRFDVPCYRALPPKARRAIRGRFACERLLGDARVLLVDDVVTSGGQVSEAAAALVDGGARSVHVAVLAQAIDATMAGMAELRPDDRVIEVHCSMENGARCRIDATVDNGKRGQLLAYYPDEVTFLAHELIGLTVEDARVLHGGRDRGYLDAPGYLRRAEDDRLGR